LTFQDVKHAAALNAARPGPFIMKAGLKATGLPCTILVVSDDGDLTQLHVFLCRKTRGAFVAAVFSMQGIGILVGASITLAVMGGFKSAHPRLPFEKDPVGSIGLPESDFAWRIVLALGAIPAALTFYYRLQLPETARYTSIVQGVSFCMPCAVAQPGTMSQLACQATF
jgi:hypothetical protein